jgi:hypothetical protein
VAATEATAELVPWRAAYRVGGVAAAAMALLTVAHAGVFFATGLPATAAEWFVLFQRSPLLGLLGFELLMVVWVVLSVPLMVALHAALRPASPSLATLYAALSLLDAAVFVTARPAFEMLSLSAGYAAASTEAQRTAYLAAGEAMVALFHGTAFWVSYVVGSISGLVLAAAMLRSRVFGKTASYLRIASSVLDFGLFVPGIGLLISLGSVLCLLVFHILVSRRLLQLARAGQSATVGVVVVPCSVGRGIAGISGSTVRSWAGERLKNKNPARARSSGRSRTAVQSWPNADIPPEQAIPEEDSDLRRTGLERLEPR